MKISLPKKIQVVFDISQVSRSLKESLHCAKPNIHDITGHHFPEKGGHAHSHRISEVYTLRAINHNP